MHHIINTEEARRRALRNLRSLIPQRATSLEEAKRIAELQANRLLALFDVETGEVPSEIVAGLPRVRVVYADLPVSGTSHWSGTHWIITLNKHESQARQRFTLMHEFKHIIDHGHAHHLYQSAGAHSAAEQAERVADHFAGCVLVPKRFLKHAWTHRLQTTQSLARHFRVSAAAIEFRLRQTRINEAYDSCCKPIVEQLVRCVRQQPPLRAIATYGALA